MEQSTNENARRPQIDLLLIQTGTRMRERFARAYDWLIGLRRVDRRRLLKRWRLSLTMLALLIATSGMPLPAHAATMTVALGASGLVNDSQCSLAEAIVNANNDAATWSDCPAGSGADIITLPANATLNYAAALATITALPDISSQVTIQGNHSTIQRTGAANYRLITVTSLGNLTLSDATLTGGQVANAGGIFNQGTLTLVASTVSGNNGLGGQGGGIKNDGTLTVLNSTISNNQTPTGNGGGIYINSGNVTIANTTISGNSTSNFGGGLAIAGGTVQVYNSTIKGNSSVNFCGGIGIQGGSISLYRSIVSGNSAPSYGNEIGNIFSTVNGNATNLFGHSGETNAQALYGFTPGGTDITATSNGTTPTALASILVTSLADNGGLTQTHNLVLGSPALDKATGDACQAAPVNGKDQRYKVRAAGAGLTCDIGAVEFNAPTAVALSSFHASASPFNLWQWLTHMWQR